MSIRPPSGGGGAAPGGTSAAVRPVTVIDSNRAVTADDLGITLVNEGGDIELTVATGLPTGFWIDVVNESGNTAQMTFADDEADYWLDNRSIVAERTTGRLMNLGEIYGAGQGVMWVLFSLDGVPSSFDAEYINLSSDLSAFQIIASGNIVGGRDVHAGQEQQDGTVGFIAHSADGTPYRLVPPNGGGAAIWVAV